MKRVLTLLLAAVMLCGGAIAFASCGCDHEETKIVGAKKATCTSSGFSGKTVCAECDEVLDEGHTIAASSHKYDSGVITKAPSCAETGIRTFTCTVCSATRTEAIATVAHSDLYHDAYDNTHMHTCLYCTMNENEAHTPTDAGRAVAATCTEPAYTEYTCSACEGVYKVYADNATALGHDFGAWETVSAPSCTADGVTKHVCKVCEYEETITVPSSANAHRYDTGVVTKAPTCTETGIRLYTCTLCEDVMTATIACTSHHYVGSTGDGSGWVLQTCDVPGCGATRTYYDAATLKVAELPVSSIPTGEDLQLGMENATIEIPSSVVDQIKGGSGSNVEIKAEFVEDTAKDSLLTSNNMTDEQKDRLADVEIYDFGISGVSSFDAAVTVTIPYTLKEGEDADGIEIWYVKNDGTVETVTATYNETTETVTFQVSHFSYYAVAYKETQAMKCRRGVHDMAPSGSPVAATCQHYGYTLYECTHCHQAEIGRIVDKLAHTYGSLQQPTVTCDEGGYSYYECSVCHEHKNVSYVRATGHTLDAAPTCTQGSVCSTCHRTVKPALGHSYGDWTVTVQPTVTTEGTKTRTCSKCGTSESVRIAPVGTVEEVEFETAEELCIFLLTEATGLTKGTVVFHGEGEGSVYDLTVDFDTTDGLVMTLTFAESYEDSVYSTVVYYEDEAAYVLDASYRDGETRYEDVYVTTLDAMLAEGPRSFEAIKTVMGAMFEYVNVYVEDALEVSDDTLALLPDDVAGELRGYLDSIRTVYAYYALRFGYDTNVVMVDGVEVPTAADYSKLLEALMTKTQTGSTFTYTYNAAALFAEIDKVVDYINDNEKVAVGSLFFDAYSEDIARIYPGVTSYEALIQKLRTDYPGTMLVKDALTGLINDMLAAEMTMEDIYSILDAALSFAAGEDVNSREMLDEYFNKSLNSMISAMMDDDEASVSDLFDELLEAGTKSLLGELIIPDSEGMTVADLADQLAEAFVEENFTFAITVVTDAEGYILSVNGSFSSAEEVFDDDPVSGNVSLDNQPEIVIPEKLRPYVGLDETVTVEPDGDVVVGGLDPDVEYEFYLSGYHYYPLAEILVKDTERTSALGFDVYCLDAKYTNTSDHVGGYLYYNGRYYSQNWYTVTVPGETEESVNLSTFLKNPSAYLPKEGDTPCGYFYDYDDGGDDKEKAATYEYVSGSTKIDVYETVAGFVYQKDGTWYIINVRESWMDVYNYSDGERRIYFHQIVSAPYAEFFASVSVDSITSAYSEHFNHWHYYQSMYGTELLSTLLLVDLVSNDAEYSAWGTVTVLGRLDGDEIVLTDNTWASSTQYYALGNPVDTLPEHDGRSEYTVELWNNGAVVEAKEVYLYRSSPSYYVEVADGVYVNIRNESFGYVNVAGLTETVTLPDGNTMIVKGREGNYVYGYVNVGGSYYVQACATEEGGSLSDVTYRNSMTSIYCSLSNIFDLEDYLVHNANGTYTVKAELFDELEALLTEGEGYSLIMEGERTVNENTDYELYYAVASDMKLPSSLDASDLFGGSGSSYRDWWYWFGSSSYYGVNLVPNADGSVSISYYDGREIDISFSGNSVDVGGFVTKDNATSSGTGLPIYSLTYNEYTSNRYVYLGGQYYNSSTYSMYNVTYFSSASAITGANWGIDELTLMIPAGNQDDDIETDVYYGTVYIDGLRNSLTVYFTIENGKLRVLTGVEVIGDSALTYEGVMDASEYFSSLKITMNTSSAWYWNSGYIDGSLKQIYCMNATVTEPASVFGQERVVSENSVLATKAGSFYKYIRTYDHEGTMLVLGERVTLDGEWVRYSLETSQYANGSFNFAWVRKPTRITNTYIEIGGRYYQYNTWSMDADLLRGEKLFEEEFYEKLYIFGVNNGGTVTYYEGDEWGDGLVEYTGAIDVSAADEVNDYGNYYQGLPTTQYVFYLRDAEDVKTTEVAGDTVYYRDSGKAYLRLNDTCYARGYLIEQEDGSYEFRCQYSDLATLPSAAMGENTALLSTVTKTAGDTVIILAPEFLDFFGEDDDVYIVIEGLNNGSSEWIQLSELRDVFALANSK